MEDYNNYNYYPRKQCVPAFGSWEWSNEVAVPFTQCFESATQAGQLLRYSYSQDRDLYVAGDLYDHDLITPAMIVVPRRRGKVRQGRVKEEKERKEGNKVKEAASPSAIAIMPRQTPKPVDEDLYKIPPELLYAKSRKVQKRGMGFFFTSCLLPTCVM